MVKPLSAVGKYQGHMLNAEFTQVLPTMYTEHIDSREGYGSISFYDRTCVAFIFFPKLFFSLSTWGVISQNVLF